MIQYVIPAKKQLLDWIKEIVPVTICCLLADMHSHSIVDDFTSGFHLYMVWCGVMQMFFL